MKQTAKLILASGSPRRRELLAQAGFAFEVQAADIDETEHSSEAPEEYVRRLAHEKAQAIAARNPDAVVLGADTTVAIDSELLGKPADRADAERMLRLLSGRAHQVHTGLGVISGSGARIHVETTTVFFRAITDDELRAYLNSGDAMDKAGAYGIQGYAARWIPRIEGDYFNVVGLPIAAVVELLDRMLVS